jgi:outer membrane biogenesis lipoprotein LolB
MRSILLLVAVAVLSGCSTTDWIKPQNRYGYRAEDPCIRCGEKWDQVHRHPFEAQFEAGTLNRKDWQ